jgi:hypothetical protein
MYEAISIQISSKQRVHVPVNIRSTDTGFKANENSRFLKWLPFLTMCSIYMAAVNYAADLALTVGRGCLRRSYCRSGSQLAVRSIVSLRPHVYDSFLWPSFEVELVMNGCATQRLLGLVNGSTYGNHGSFCIIIPAN